MTDSDDVIVTSSASPDRSTVVAVLCSPGTTVPLTICTTAVWPAWSLNVNVPLSSEATPLIVNATCPAPANPIGVVEPPFTSTLGCSPVSRSSVTPLPLALNSLAAASVTNSDDVIVTSSASPDRSTVVAVLCGPSTTVPLTICTTTVWPAWSLKVSVPLSSEASPLIVNATCPAPAAPIGVVEPPFTSTLGCSPVSRSSVTPLPLALN